ncbi:MAG: dipeptide epimerase [Sphingomonas sp.]|nr:MAG: dipeptide epimerase [Sphingomonas sp.]
MTQLLTSRIEQLPLERPFRISRGVKTMAEVVTVEVRRGDTVGRGEAVPYARYGETPESVLAQIIAATPALSAPVSRAELASLLPPGAARNAVDCALWDLESALGGRSVGEIAGWGEPGPVITALTVSLDTPEKMAAAAAEIADVPLIKVKVDGDDPAAAIRAVREAAPAARLIVDPNESWDMALLEQLQPLLEEMRVSFVEQPLPAGEDSCLDGFRPRIPVCADESCHTVDDLEVLAGRYGMVNIKLDKTGGLTGAIDLLSAARALDLGVMVGCMVSSSLSIAPALHVAARADYADLDGPVWLAQDRPGGVTVRDGLMFPPAPGFWGQPIRTTASTSTA